MALNDALGRLGKVYASFREITPPTDSRDPKVSRVLDEVVVYGADVAGTVERLLNRERVPAEFRHLLKFDEKLRERVNRMSNDRTRDAHDLRQLFAARDYLDQIRELLRDAIDTDSELRP